MSVRFEDILAALCSEVTLSHANESQKVFLVHDDKEARLVCDLLMAYGFDAKSYPQDDASKLYITLPPPDPAAEEKLSAALAYAASLKSIKQNMDALCSDNAAIIQSPDYQIVFANMLPAGKQIIIRLVPAASPPVMVEQHAPLPQAAPAAANARKAALVQKKPRRGDGQPFLYDGPSVGERGRHLKRVQKSSSAWKEAYNYMYGHFTATTYGVILAVVFLFFVFALFTFSKAFLCPDFATTKKNTAWYCQQSSDTR